MQAATDLLPGRRTARVQVPRTFALVSGTGSNQQKKTKKKETKPGKKNPVTRHPRRPRFPRPSAPLRRRPSMRFFLLLFSKSWERKNDLKKNNKTSRCRGEEMKIHDSTLFLFLRPSAVIRNEMGFFKERTFQQQQQQQKGRKTIISLGFECIERRQRPRVSGSVHCFFFF